MTKARVDGRFVKRLTSARFAGPRIAVQGKLYKGKEAGTRERTEGGNTEASYTEGSYTERS